jgi:hypothetical protein
MNELKDQPFVVETCLGYLCRIATTGVEDKMPRTKIIISSRDNILDKTSPKIMDPTFGFGEERPNIFTRNFYQTFKNWAVLTGCICLDTQGNVIAVGREVAGYERPMSNDTKWGLQSSSRFDCVIIEVISRDHIIVYKNGTIIMEVKNERAEHSPSPIFANA